MPPQTMKKTQPITNPALKTPPTKSAQKNSTLLGKRPHREVIDDFENIYATYKRQKRSNKNQTQAVAPAVD